MNGILNKYKRWPYRFRPIRTKELDCVLSLDMTPSVDIDGNLTKKCLISYVDMTDSSCIVKGGGAVSKGEFSYENSLNDGALLEDIGLTATDNGFIRYNKNIMKDEFIGIVTGSTAEIISGDTRLHLFPVGSNVDSFEYGCEHLEDESGSYYAMRGGFLQGFYKLFNFDYQILPKDIEDCWNMEFVIRPRKEYKKKETNKNDGIFFYIGTRSENKFAKYYGDNISRFPTREGYSDDCAKVKEETKIQTKSEHPIERNDFYEITTDNKFIIFNRTCDGFTVRTWHEGDVMSLVGHKDILKENLFLLMDRTCSGHTVSDIDDYLRKKSFEGETYKIEKDLMENSFALKVNEDGSIGYKYGIKDCDAEDNFSIVEENTFPGMINDGEWSVINVMFKILSGGTDKCGNSTGKRLMKIYIYVNGYLKLVSKALPEFRFRELDDVFDKQECVPFNISLGGGTQGLRNSVWVDNYKDLYCKILPLEENFFGSFFGDIRSFKFYNCQMQYNEIYNNYLYEMKNTPTDYYPKFLNRIGKYVWEVKYDEFDYDYAREYFKNRFEPHPALCSSLRNGNWYARNLDFYYSNNATFVIRTDRTDRHYASISVSGSMPGITKDFVESGEKSELYKVAPFLTQDGINEFGVMCNINVVPVNENDLTRGTHWELPEEKMLVATELVRFILDHYKTAREAVEDLRDNYNIYCPFVIGYEMHFMICDMRDSYCLEFVNNSCKIIKYGCFGVTKFPILTNFRLFGAKIDRKCRLMCKYPEIQYYRDMDYDEMLDYKSVEKYGEGTERYDLIYNKVLRAKNNQLSYDEVKDLFVNELRYGQTYEKSHNPTWYSEFTGNMGEKYGDLTLEKAYETPEAFEKYISAARNLYEKKERRDDRSSIWITEHTSIYDIKNRRLHLWSQEGDKRDGFNDKVFEFYEKDTRRPRNL